MFRTILAIVSVPYLAITAWALYEVGFTGIFAAAVAGPGEAQVFADLVVALVLSLGLLAEKARASGRTFWPLPVATLALGSLAPLAFFYSQPSAAGEVGQQGV